MKATVCVSTVGRDRLILTADTLAESELVRLLAEYVRAEGGLPPTLAGELEAWDRRRKAGEGRKAA